MKKFLQYTLIIILFSTWGIIVTNKESFREIFQGAYKRVYQTIHKPCSEPIKYSIGQIDPRFDISSADFQKTIDEAAHLWDDSLHKNLFQYDPNSSFKINLVYDQRQEQTIESQKLENNLSDLESSHAVIMKQYNNLNSAYKKKLDDYQNALANYERDLKKYNNEVDSWNLKGGAPPDVYSELKKEKKQLQDEFSQLEAQRREINSIIGQTNDLAQKDKSIVTNYNSNLATYKDKYGESSQFDKGVYDGRKIDIFQYNEKDDLRLTIAHELGHALEIDHLESPQSIMYYLMGEQDLDNPHLSLEDISALDQVCGVK